MRILVSYKVVEDPDSRTRSGDVRRILNPFDEIAIEEAVRLREAEVSTEALGVTIGPEESEPALTALAMGLDRVICIDDDRRLDQSAVAEILGQVVRILEPDLVLLGKLAVDDDAGQVGPMLAGRLGWPQATFVSRLSWHGDEQRFHCVRETDAGLETVSVPLPAVVTTDLRLNEPRYVARPARIRARKKPSEVWPLSDLAPVGDVRTRTLSTEPVPERDHGEIVGSVAELADRLRPWRASS